MSEQEKPVEPVKPVKPIKEIKEASPKSTKNDYENIAVILVRGTINKATSVKDTLAMLGLKRKNACVIIKGTINNRGMLNKIKDVITWGVIDNETHKALKDKRGKEDTKCFHLNPPRKGYGRKGIKQPFKLGGALGNRKEKINDLILRMI